MSGAFCRRDPVHNFNCLDDDEVKSIATPLYLRLAGRYGVCCVESGEASIGANVSDRWRSFGR
jgi:hypothetical protein